MFSSITKIFYILNEVFSFQSNMSTQRHSLPYQKVNGSSSIPLRRQISKQALVTGNSRIPVNDPQVHRWKQKYDESEERRKILLSEKEKGKPMIL